LPNNKFIWNEEKHKANIIKHGISFTEAISVFDDDDALYLFDEEHSIGEERFIVIGVSEEYNMLMVSHCYRNGDNTTRIISARKANIKEQAQYRRR